jgi:antitoxin YefM
MRTTNYTDLRNNLKNYLDKVINDSEPLIVHRSGNESVIVISLDEYNSIKETEYIKSSPIMIERIKAAENDIQAGRGKAIKTADIWK